MVATQILVPDQFHLDAVAEGLQHWKEWGHCGTGFPLCGRKPTANQEIEQVVGDLFFNQRNDGQASRAVLLCPFIRGKAG